MGFGKRLYAMATKGSVKATLVGLGCIVTYRYLIKPIAWNESISDNFNQKVFKDSPILSLDSTTALEVLGNSTSLVLFVHDYSPEQTRHA